MKFLAGVIVVPTALCAAGAFLYWLFVGWASDPDELKGLFTDDVLNRLGAILVDIAQNEIAEAGGDVRVEPALAHAFVDRAMAGPPRDHLEEVIHAAIDGTYDFFDTGDPERLSIEIDRELILSGIRGERGRTALVELIGALPPCPEGHPGYDLARRQLVGGRCLPPDLDATEAAHFVHDELGNALPERASMARERYSMVAEGARPGTADYAADLEEWQNLRARFASVVGWQRLVWLPTLIGFVFILAFAARDARSFAYWSGMRAAAAGAATVLLALLLGGLFGSLGERVLAEAQHGAADATPLFQAMAVPFEHVTGSLLARARSTGIVAGLIGLGVLAASMVGARATAHGPDE